MQKKERKIERGWLFEVNDALSVTCAARNNEIEAGDRRRRWAEIKVACIQAEIAEVVEETFLKLKSFLFNTPMPSL